MVGRRRGFRLLILAAVAAVATGFAAPRIAQGAPAPAVALASSQTANGERPQFAVTGHVRQIDLRDAVNDKSLRWFAKEQTTLEILEPAYYVSQVTFVNGQPTFDFGLDAASDDVIAASQVAVDEETGEAILAVGVPTLSSLRQAADGGADIPAWVLESNGTGPTSPSAEIASAVWEPGRGAFGTWWTDPIGLTVSDVITEIRWEYNGTNVRSPVVDDVTYVFQPNGWTELSHTRGAYLNGAQTVATGYSQAHHATSSWFPSPSCGTTRVKYYSNSAYGNWTGGISGGVTTWTEGPCGGLLSVQAFVFQGQV